MIASSFFDAAQLDFAIPIKIASRAHQCLRWRGDQKSCAFPDSGTGVPSIIISIEEKAHQLIPESPFSDEPRPGPDDDTLVPALMTSAEAFA
jgi:hypothetical protein